MPYCVNDNHLVAGTHADNAEDKVARRRSVRGSKASWSKLTEADVLVIRASAGPSSEVAKQFNVSISTVSDIRQGRRWSWLLQEEAA
jgi:hypothetical protein